MSKGIPSACASTLPEMSAKASGVIVWMGTIFLGMISAITRLISDTDAWPLVCSDCILNQEFCSICSSLSWGSLLR